MARTYHQIRTLQERIKHCIKTSQDKANVVDTLLTEVAVSKDMQNTPITYRDLMQEKDDASNKMSYCYLANYKLEKLGSQIKQELETNKSYNILTK